MSEENRRPPGRLLEAEDFKADDLAHFSYDERGLLTRSDDGRGGLTHFSYDERGLLSDEIRHFTDERVSYTYDPRGLLSNIETNDGTTDFIYDERGLLTEKQFGNGMSNRRSYNTLGQITQESLARRHQVYRSTGYVYDQRDQVSYKISEKGELTAYQYDEFGRLHDVYYSHDGRFISASLDERKEAGLHAPHDDDDDDDDDWDDWDDDDYHGNHTGIQNPERLTISSGDRSLILDTWDSQDKQGGHHFNFNQNFWYEQYRYNEDGQRTEKADAWGTITYEYDSDRMTGRGNNTLSYDANGNLLSEVGPEYDMAYGYSVDNRMVSASTSEHNRDIEILFAYDALGRRASREENIYKANNGKLKGSLTDDYFYAGTAMQLSSRSYKQGGDNDDDDWRRTIKQDYFYGSGDLISFTGERDTYHAYTDYQGSMTAYVDRHSLEDDYLYDAFGTPVRGRFDGDNALGYNGKVFDTITGLYDYGFRDYSPAYGNFTTVDPVRDSVNWYAYVGMNPVNRVDLWGLLEVYAEDIHGAPIVVTPGRDLKAETSIVITRGNEHILYGSTAEIRVGDQILFQEPVQSHANIPEPELTEIHEGSTLKPGNYIGTIREPSPELRYPESIILESEEHRISATTDAYLIHAGSQSAGCQVLCPADFEVGKRELQGLGYKPGDSLPVAIKEGR